MSDTINIPVELYDDLVKVVNRLQACNRSVETSQKQGRDTPEPASKKTLQVQRAKREMQKIKELNSN